MRLVRMRVPAERTLMRCPVKKYLKQLPSLFLVLVVVSLICITLLQIAIVHANRRIHYFNRSDSAFDPSLSPSSAASSTLSHYHAQYHHPQPETTPPRHHPQQLQLTTRQQQVHKHLPVKRPVRRRRLETVRLEAVFDKNAPSIETNALILLGSRNAERVRSILNAMSDLEDAARTRSKMMRSNSSRDDRVSRTFDSRIISNSASAKERQTVGRSLNVVPNFKGELKKKAPCPLIPPHLEGRVKVDMTPHHENNMSAISLQNPFVKPGGNWYPQSCISRHHVAIIIPYRDRLQHLSILLAHLHPILQRQMLNYRVYVIEQMGSDTFNKGVLMNAGVREALKEADFHCFVFHDVDLIPEDDRNMYSCPPMPRHMSVGVDKFNYTLPYTQLVGGVFAIRTTHLLHVNGYSNLYWGWGGEDDDLAYRLDHYQLNIIRPPDSIARYSMIKHAHRPESPSNVRTALLRMARKRAARDGLNTVKYSVSSRSEFPLYTHLVINIGNNHRWQFVQGRRLIMHF